MISSTQLADTSQGDSSKDLDPSKWNFEMFNPKEDKDNVLLNAYCHVCFRLNDKAAQKCNFKNEKGLNMIHCYGCLTSVHIYCYGMETPYKVESTSKGEKVYMFLCDKCRVLGPDAEQICQVCKQSDGGLKRCDDGTWVHMVCALFTDTFNIPNYQTMEVCRVNRTDKDIGTEKKKGRPPACDHCGVYGSLVKCCDTGCNKHSHIYCILKTRALQDRSKIKVDAVPHGTYWSFSLVINDRTIEKKIQAKQKSYPLFSINGKKITDYAEHVNKLMDDYNIINPKREDDHIMKKKRGKKKETTSRLDDPFVNQLLSTVLDKGSFAFKTGEGDEGFTDSPFNDLKNAIPKRILTHCTAHRVTEKYCICDNSSSNENNVMVGCDSCENWFHDSCIGLQEDQISQIDKYFCVRCRDWGEIKVNILEDMDLQQNEKLALTTPYKFKQFIPKNTVRFTICDLMTSGLLFEILVQRALTSAISFKELHKLILHSFVLPLNFLNQVRSLCYKIFKVMVLDETLLQNDITDFKIESCLTFDNKIKEDVLENNSRMLESLEKLFKLYHTDCYITTDIYTKLENIIFFLRWQQKTIEILQTRTLKPQLEEVEALLSEYNHIALTYSPQTTVTEGGSADQGNERMSVEMASDPIVGEFYEKQQLEALIHSCKEWLEEYNNLLKKSVENLEEFHNSIENEGEDCMIIEEVAMNAEEETSISKATKGNIEKVIRRYIEFQDNKIKAQELEELLRKAEQFPVYFTQELKFILDEKEKTEEFRNIITQINSPQLTPEMLQKIIIDNDSYVLHVPEMKELYELLRQFKIFNTKYLYLTSRIDANIKFYSQVSKENLKKNEKPMKITIDDVKRTLQEAKLIPLNLSMYILPLQERLNETLKFQNKLNSFLHKPLDTQELQALKHEAFKLGLFIPEIETIKDKINLSAEIKNKIQGESTYEKIEFQLELAERHMLDATLISELRLKRTQVEQLKQHSLIFISKKFYGEKDLKKVYTLLYEARKAHIDFPEKNHLLNVLKSFSWFVKLWLLLNALSKPNQDALEDKANNLFDKFDISLVFKLNIAEDIGFCTQQTTQETLMQNAEKYMNQFQSLMREGAQITHPDIRLKELYDLYAKKLWVLEVKKLKSSSNPIDPAFLLKLYEQATSFQIEKLDENYQWLGQLYHRYDSWINVFTSNIYLKDLRTLCEPDTIHENHAIIQELIEKYPMLNIQMGHIHKAIHYINNSMEWLFKAEKCQSLLQNGRKISYDALRDLYNIAIDLNLPPDFPYYDKISAIYTNATTLIDESLEFFKVIDEFDLNQEIKTLPAPEHLLSEPKFRLCVDVTTGQFKMNFYEKIEERYSFGKALRLYQQLKESHVSFDKDIEVIGVHIKKYENWSLKISDLRRRYKFEENMMSVDEFSAQSYLRSIEKLIEEIDTLKLELTNQILSEDQKENEIFLFEWALAALLLLNKQDLLAMVPYSMRPADSNFKEDNFMVWESMINCLKKHENRLSSAILKKVQKSFLYRKLTEQIMKAKHYIDMALDLIVHASALSRNAKDMSVTDLRGVQDRDYLRTIAEHKQNLKEMEELLVNIRKEQTYVGEIIKKYQDIMKQYESMEIVQHLAAKPAKLNKVNLPVVENLLRDLLALPVRYTGEEKNLADALKAYDVIERDLARITELQQATGKETIDSRLAELILKRYRESLIFHTEAEKILKEFEKVEPALHRAEILIGENKLTAEEALRYYEILRNSKIEFGVRIEKARMRLWQRLVDLVKACVNENNREIKSQESPVKNMRVTYDILKCLIADAYAVFEGKSSLGHDVSNTILMLEELIEKVEERLREVYSTTEAKAVAKMESLAFGFVNLKNEVTTHYQKLVQDPTYSVPKISTVLKYPLRNQQNNIQGIVIYKNSSVTPTPVATAIVKGKPGRKSIRSKELEKTEKPKRKESDDLTVNEAAGKKGKRKLKGGLEEEEDEEELKKKLKTDNGSQKIQNKDEEVKAVSRERTVNQLIPLIEENSHFTHVMNKVKFNKQLAEKLEENIFKEFGDNRNQYNVQSKVMKGLFSKLKNFKNISRNLNRFQFDIAIIKYLIDNTTQFDTIENALKPSSQKTIMNFVNKNDPNAPPTITLGGPMGVTINNFTSVANGITSLTGPTTGTTNYMPSSINTQSTVTSAIPSQNGETSRYEANKQQAQEEEDRINSLLKDLQNEECPKFPFKEVIVESLPQKSSGLKDKEERKEIAFPEVEFQHKGHVLQKSAIFDSASPPRRKKEIYRIYNGEFAFIQGNSADEEGRRVKVMLMTMEPYEYLQNFPRITPKGVKMAAKLDLKELEPYVDKIMESESRNFKVLLGWFQSADGDNTMLNENAAYLKRNKRAGRCKYVNNCTLYSLHVDDLKPGWLLKTNLDILADPNSKQIKPSSLAFLMVSKNYQITLEEPPLETQIVYRGDELDNSISSDSENNIMSPGSPVMQDITDEFWRARPDSKPEAFFTNKKNDDIDRLKHMEVEGEKTLGLTATKALPKYSGQKEVKEKMNVETVVREEKDSTKAGDRAENNNTLHKAMEVEDTGIAVAIDLSNRNSQKTQDIDQFFH